MIEATPLYRGGAGEPLVVLHGGGATWRLWKPAIERLESRFAVLAPTLTAHWGGPPVPPGSRPTIHLLADDVERAMDAAGFEDAHVAGGSLGGWVTLELALRGRTRTAVAIAPAGGWAKGGAAFAALTWQYRTMQHVARLLARRPERWSRSPLLRRLMLSTHFAHPEKVDPEECAHLLVAVARCAPFEDFIPWAREYDAVPALREIDCPVLLAFPARDRVLPRRFYGERLVDALPEAEVVDLPRVGHAAMVDDPGLVAELIDDFVRRRARQPAVPA